MVTKSRYLTASLVLIGVLFSGGVLVAAVDFLDADSKAFIIGDGSSVVVTGRIQCTDGDTFSVTAIVAQNVRQGSVISTGTTSGLRYLHRSNTDVHRHRRDPLPCRRHLQEGSGIAGICRRSPAIPIPSSGVPTRNPATETHLQ